LLRESYREITNLVVSDRSALHSPLTDPDKKSSQDLHRFIYTHAVITGQGQI
jgi:hypothetical protein